MNKKILIAASIVACMTMNAFAHHHHHDGFWGGFVGGLFGGLLSSPRTTVVAQPAPVVVTQPVVAQPVVAQPVIATPAPVVQTTTVVAQPPATITYGIYNGVSCPTYNGYYFHNNVWCWGGPIHAHRPPPPHWHPHHRPPHHHHYHR